MSTLENIFIPDNAVSMGHVQIPKQPSTLRCDGRLVERTRQARCASPHVRQVRISFGEFCCGMLDERPLSMVATAFVASSGTLSTFWASLVALVTGSAVTNTTPWYGILLSCDGDRCCSLWIYLERLPWC